MIRDRRRAAGLDQKTLAKRVGVSRQWLIDVEHGKPRAAVGLILRTLQALGAELVIDEVRDPPTTTTTTTTSPIDAVLERAKQKMKK